MTGLTADRLAELREAAHAEAGPFVDPVRMREWNRARPLTNGATWAAAVLGGPPAGQDGKPSYEQMILLLEAAKADAAWLADAREREAAVRLAAVQEAAQLAAARRDAERRAWHEVRAALPVSVTVGHNWTLGHYDGHVTGREPHRGAGRAVRWPVAPTGGRVPVRDPRPRPVATRAGPVARRRPC
jgi:hypothetical protein